MLGNAQLGLVAGWFGLTVAITGGGAMCVLGVLSCIVFLPKFWKYEENVDAKPN